MFRQNDVITAFNDWLVHYQTSPAILHLIKQHKTSIIEQLERNLGLTSNATLSNADKKNVLEELDRLIYFAGNATPLFDQKEYLSPAANATSDEILTIKVQNILKLLLAGTAIDISALYNKDIIDAIIKTRNPNIIRLIKTEFKRLLNNLSCDHLQQLDENGKKAFEFQLSNLLALYTIFEPDENEEITFPTPCQSKWEKVTYQVKRIELAPSASTQPELYRLYQSKDIFKVYAFGLTPKTHHDASPYLLFMGTPPETSQGHHFAVLTDVTPEKSVGEQIHIDNHNAIQRWLHEATNYGERKAYVTGQSLGGALSLLLTLHCPYLLKRVDAMNPPGLYASTYQLELFSIWDRTDGHLLPEVYIHLQKHDLVKDVGYFKQDARWQLIKLFSTASVVPIATNYLGHLQGYANQADCIALRVNTERENGLLKRERLTKLKERLDEKAYHARLNLIAETGIPHCAISDATRNAIAAELRTYIDEKANSNSSSSDQDLTEEKIKIAKQLIQQCSPDHHATYESVNNLITEAIKANKALETKAKKWMFSSRFSQLTTHLNRALQILRDAEAKDMANTIGQIRKTMNN